MDEAAIEADYLIIGAGAAGLAFADSLLASSDKSMVIVDRRDRPGGHWNDAYPFVRLHQPAQTYGVNSVPLGSGAKDETGLNKGLYDLASGQEVLSHFEFAMKHRLLPSGRVTYLPISEVGDDGSVRSLLSGHKTSVSAGKVVDATYSQTSIPATHVPNFRMASGVPFGPPNELPRRAADHTSFVVIGAGKTGMDTCIWLLENGADPDTICWVMPRDAWLLDRANFQPGSEFLERGARSIADQVEALAAAHSIDDLFERLESFGELRRIDPAVKPRAYHCAIVSDGELEQLRRIQNVVRLGRVTEVGVGKLTLEEGVLATDPAALHVDCSAIGVPHRPVRPIFDGDRITLQFVRTCQPTFSAALLGHLEASFSDDSEKNDLCAPIPTSSVPLDWLRMISVDLRNRYRWSKTPQIDNWLATARLDNLAKQFRSLTGSETAVIGHLQRYVAYVGAAAKNAQRLLQGASPP